MFERKCKTCGNVVLVESKYVTIVQCEDCQQKLGKIPKGKRDYDTEEFIYCRICNIVKRRLDFHIKKMHNLTLDEYKNKYNAPVFAKNSMKLKLKDDECRQKMSKAAKASWSNEDVRKFRCKSMRDSLKIKVLSEEHKQRISESLYKAGKKRRPLTLERRKNKKRNSKCQLKEFVVCPLCLKETNDEILSRVGLMTTSHLKRHNYTTKQFRLEYPEIKINRDDKRLIWEEEFDINSYIEIINQFNKSKLQDSNNKIYCRYCLKCVKRMSARHLDKHKLTINMYQKIFVNAPLVTRDVVERSSFTATKTMLDTDALIFQNRGYYGFRRDVGHFVRSTIEANFCRMLKLNNIHYEYEKEIFKLNDKDFHAYIPDIKLLDNFEYWKLGTYIELKQTIGDESLRKINVFKLCYPDKIINVLEQRSDIWRRLKRKYMHLIPLWETGSQNIKVTPSLYCRD